MKPQPITEPGWYRLTEAGWVPVDPADAELEAMSGGGWDLVKVEFEGEQVALW